MRYSKEEIRNAMLLYAVTDRMWLGGSESLTDVCRQVLQNGATFLQVREKDLGKEEFKKESAGLKCLCAEYHVPFVVNDSVEIAMEIDADGVHVGQSDIQGRDIRAIIGPDKILGMTARTVDEAVAAEQAGADYLGVGAIFTTSTKKDTRHLTMEELRRICASVSIPVVAIGGINEKNLPELKGSGVAGAAVVSAIFAAGDPGAATAHLLELAKEVVNE